MVNKKQTQYTEILNERVKLNWVKVETQVKHHQKKLANNAKDHRKLLWNLLRTESLLEQKIRENLQVQTQFSNIIESVERGNLKSIQFFKSSDLIAPNAGGNVLTSDEEQTVTTFQVNNNSSHTNLSSNPVKFNQNTNSHPHHSASSKNPTSSYFIQKFTDILKDFKKLPANRQTDIQDKYLSQPSIEATINLAQSYFYSGNNEKAIELINQAISTKRDEHLEQIIYNSRNQNEIDRNDRNITNSSILSPPNVDALTVLHLRLFSIAYSILGLLSEKRSQQLLHFKNAVDRTLGYLSLHQLASLKILPNIVAIAVCRYVKLKLEGGEKEAEKQTKKDVFMSIIPYLCETDVYPEKTVKEIPESVNNVSLRTLITRFFVDSSKNSENSQNQQKSSKPIPKVSTSQFSTIWHLANNISSSTLILCFDETSDKKEVSDLFKILDLALTSCQIPYGHESESEQSNWYKIGECFRTLGKIELANAAYLKCGDGDFRASLRLGHAEKSDLNTYQPFFQQKILFWNRLQTELKMGNFDPNSDDSGSVINASNDYLIHFLHARFLTISGKNLDSALKSIKTSVSLNSGFSHSWLLFAIILSLKGAYRKAIQAISFGRRQADDKLDLVIRFTELEAQIYENAGVSGLCFEEKSVKLENSVSTDNFIEDHVENVENGQVEKLENRKKAGKLTKVEKTGGTSVCSLDVELIDLEPEGKSDIEKWFNEAYKSYGTVIDLCNTLIDQNDLNETDNVQNFGSFNQFSNTKILPESHLETRSHNSKSYKETTKSGGPNRQISNGYSNSMGFTMGSTFGGQNSISKQNSSQYFSHNQYLGTSNASGFNGSSNFHTLPNVQSHQIAAAQSTVFDRASLASHDSVQNNLSSGEVTLDFGVHTSNQLPVSFMATRTISHVNVICRALHSQAEINLSCAGSTKTELKNHKTPQIIEKQLAQLAKIKENYVDPAVTAQIQYSILCYEKFLQDNLKNNEESHSTSSATSYFVSSTSQLNRNNDQTKSVSTTLARAALTSIALDQSQVKGLLESENENTTGSLENGGLKNIHNHAIQHLTKALELAYQLPSTSSTRQILEKRLLIRQILHIIVEHHLTSSNHELAANFLDRVPGKNFETFSLFGELNFKQQQVLSSSSGFFVKHSGNGVKLSNIMESSENEFSNIDSPEDEEVDTFGEIGQGNGGVSRDTDIIEVLGLIEDEKTALYDFHDSDLVRRFLPADFVQNLVFNEFFGDETQGNDELAK